MGQSMIHGHSHSPVPFADQIVLSGVHLFRHEFAPLGLTIIERPRLTILFTFGVEPNIVRIHGTCNLASAFRLSVSPFPEELTAAILNPFGFEIDRL
jgi:hypothetical protein